MGWDLEQQSYPEVTIHEGLVIDEGFFVEEPVPKEIKVARWWLVVPALSIQAESWRYTLRIL